MHECQEWPHIMGISFNMEVHATLPLHYSFKTKSLYGLQLSTFGYILNNSPCFTDMLNSPRTL